MPALSGFHYDAIDKRLTVTPPTDVHQTFQSFWSVPSGWGRVQRISQGSSTKFSLEPVAGTIVVQEVVLSWPRRVSLPTTIKVGSRSATVAPGNEENTITLKFEEPLEITGQFPMRFLA
jgi:hypothetical protein